MAGCLLQGHPVCSPFSPIGANISFSLVENLAWRKESLLKYISSLVYRKRRGLESDSPHLILVGRLHFHLLRTEGGCCGPDGCEDGHHYHGSGEEEEEEEEGSSEGEEEEEEEEEMENGDGAFDDVEQGGLFFHTCM